MTLSTLLPILAHINTSAGKPYKLIESIANQHHHHQSSSTNNEVHHCFLLPDCSRFRRSLGGGWTSCSYLSVSETVPCSGWRADVHHCPEGSTYRLGGISRGASPGRPSGCPTGRPSGLRWTPRLWRLWRSSRCLSLRWSLWCPSGCCSSWSRSRRSRLLKDRSRCPSCPGCPTLPQVNIFASWYRALH